MVSDRYTFADLQDPIDGGTLVSSFRTLWGYSLKLRPTKWALVGTSNKSVPEMAIDVSKVGTRSKT